MRESSSPEKSNNSKAMEEESEVEDETEDDAEERGSTPHITEMDLSDSTTPGGRADSLRSFRSRNSSAELKAYRRRRRAERVNTYVLN